MKVIITSRETLRIRAERVFPVPPHDYLLWRTLATVLEGVSMTALGQAEEGLVMTETGISLYRALTTPPVFSP